MPSTMSQRASARLTIRPGRMSDREALLAIGAGGAGELSQRRDRLGSWLRDPSVLLVIAEDRLDGVIGTAQVVRHGSEEWWLQGVRVADSARGRGVATRLWAAAVRWADDTQVEAGTQGTLRLCCDTENVAGHRLALRFGCLALGEFVRLAATVDLALGPPSGVFQPVTGQDVGGARRLLGQSATFRTIDRLMFSRPVVARVVDDDRLHQLVESRRVHAWYAPGSTREPDAVVIHDTSGGTDEHRGGGEMIVGAFACPNSSLAMFAADVTRWGALLGCATVSAFVPDDPTDRAALQSAGWAPLPGGRALIYRRPLGVAP